MLQFTPIFSEVHDGYRIYIYIYIYILQWAIIIIFATEVAEIPTNSANSHNYFLSWFI